MKRLKRIFRMSPPLLVTEDTPPDMLTGHMDLPMVLPNGNRVRMSVDRRTPMMDLLVQVTTAYKISPAGHVLQPYGECGVLPYKPSTPIGALDTWTVHIVPKNQALQNPASKISLKQVQQPFEQTFRFQVNLPKNQLYVTRVTGRTMMGDLLRQACSEKGLDHHKYSLRHPKHLDRNLNEDLSVVEYGHNQVSMVSNKTLPSSVSSEDILAMAAYSGKSSKSSSRSLSPDSSVSPQAPVQPSRPIRKRRPAPKPPVQPSQPNQKAKPKEKDTQKDPPSNGPVICHSRTSSDSSGYHEASVLSESPDSNNSSLPDSLPRRSKLPSKSEPKPSNKLSRSLSNLHHESTAPSTSMKPAQSTSCLAPSRKKKPAPAPPVLAIEEEKEEAMPARSSRTLPPGVRLVEVEPRAQHRPSNPSNRLASPPIVATSVEPKGLKIKEEPTIVSQKSLSDIETERVEDEIERMFEEATREHVSLESGVDVCDSSPGLPSPEASGLPSPDLIHDTPHEPLPLLPDTPDQKNEDDPFNWEYKLPAPPTFRDVVDRDDTSSPLLTEYSTMTVGNMKEVLYQPSAAGDGPEPPKIIGVMERRAAQELAASERRAALDLAASERRAAQVLAASERRGAQELAAVERRTAAQATVERLAVAEELAAVVEAPNRGLAASKVPEPAAPLADPLLDNFRITTYLGIKESVKVFEEKTTPKRFETNLARRSSFTDNDQPRKVGGRPYLSGGVKRSVSHVSPLTRARMGLSVSNVDLASVSDSDRVGPSVSSRNLTTADLPEPVFCLPRTGLRKTISELSINIDPSDERDEYHENDERENGLQSISVLRSILPQLSRSQTALNSIGSSNHEMPSAVKEVQGGFRRPNISLSTWGERPKRQISIKSDKDYVIGGAKPAVNDARTINGAVKEPVLVNGAKPAARPVEKPATPEKPSAGVVKTPSFKGPKTMAYKMLETGNTKPLKQILEKEKFIEPVKSTPKFQEFDSGDGLESEHAPIVRAVELKKPYKMELENRMIKDPVPPPSLPEDSLPTPFYLKPTAEPVANPSTLFDQRRLKPGAEHAKSASNPHLFRMKSADDQTKPAVELAKPAQPFDQRRLKPAEAERLTANPSALFDQRRLKPAEARRPSERPVSSYLFGCEPTVPPPPNPPPPPKKYMSIVDLSRPLKPVASRSSKPRQREVDPREELMSSIRKFGKNSLRKVSAR